MSKTRIIDSVRNLDLASTKKLLSANPSLLTVTDRQGRNLLHLACSAPCADLKLPESASTRMVDFLLDRGLDVESTIQAGKDPCDTVNAVWFAVARGRNPRTVKLLIRRGGAPNGLFAAGWYEDIPMLKLLLQAGAPIDVVVGMTPFLACWCWKKFKAAKFLATNGANVNYQDPENGKTALHYGVEKEFDPGILRWLVQNGASPDIEDNAGDSARRKASRKRDKRFAASLE
jgi:ankyrin repeat protein